MTVPDDAAVDAFWRWWSGRYREVLAEAVDEQRVAEVIEPLLTRLHKVHPNLGCDLRLGVSAPGTKPRIALVIDARGEVPDGLVKQLLAAAPTRDDRWDYGSMNIPITDPRELELQAGERTIDLARMSVGMQIDPDEMVVHLAVYHPELAEVSAEQQHFVVRTALNAVAGHAPPRRYRTKLRLTHREPGDAVDLAELRVRLADLEV
ncbi:MAG TPA: hypothetical protein VE709_02300 [Pseudonocardiaceae bacterium]|nr:hypothetical protein [Pseudonocardiaceae bacterium]